jgi:hypothetical protein
MKTTTYRILQLALSAHLQANENILAHTKQYLRGEKSIKYWEKEVEATKDAIADAREIYEAGVGFAKWN